MGKQRARRPLRKRDAYALAVLTVLKGRGKEKEGTTKHGGNREG